MNGLRSSFFEDLGVITTPFYSEGRRKVGKRSTMELAREFDYDRDELAVLSRMSLNWRLDGSPPPYENQAVRLASKYGIPYGFLTNFWSEGYDFGQWFLNYLLQSRVLILLPKMRKAEVERVQNSFSKKTRLIVGNNEPRMVAEFLFSALFCQD
ncbi:MAG: hypothetical protein AAB453_00150 [Patescibacteria group bacterium]